MEYLAGILMAGAAMFFSVEAVARRWVLSHKIVNVDELVFLKVVLASLTAFVFAAFCSGWHTPFRDAPVLF